MENSETETTGVSETADVSDEAQPEFQALTREQRRIVGVLIEKSKTTPQSYPMTLNSIKTAANQKSNRSPQMNIAADDVEFVLDELRELRAVVEIRGDGRVSKYKHRMYQWLGVEKVEIAVMGELLLRGEQTLGELRARSSRMESIGGMDELRPIVSSLVDKGLMVELTPKGRGQIVTHNLYQEHELDRLRSQIGSGSHNDDLAGVERIPAAVPQAKAAPDPGSEASSKDQAAELIELRELVKSLIARIEKLEQRA